MPFVTIQIAKGHSVEQKRELAKAVTDTLVSSLGTKPEWVTIHIDEFERENWAVGGELHIDKHSGRHGLRTMELTSTDAEQLALDFFLEDWEIPEDDRDFFIPLDSRGVDNQWYVVEIGVEGLPDKWVIQVYDETKDCDPCFTFVSPIKASESETGLEEMPESIAKILRSERQSKEVFVNS